MPTILTCRLQFTLVGTVFHSEEFHIVEVARKVANKLLLLGSVKAVAIVDANGQTVEVLS